MPIVRPPDKLHCRQVRHQRTPERLPFPPREAGDDMRRYLIIAGLAALIVANLAPAWWVKGHASIAEAAALGLPEDVPAFFRAGGKMMGH